MYKLRVYFSEITEYIFVQQQKINNKNAYKAIRAKSPKLTINMRLFSKNYVKTIFRIGPPIQKGILWDIIISDSIYILLDPLQRQLCLEEEMKSLVREVLPLMQNRGEKF